MIFLLQVGFKGFGINPENIGTTAKFEYEGKEYELKHGSVVIAAITSCTNTSNPSVMLGAGTLQILCEFLSRENSSFVRKLY